MKDEGCWILVQEVRAHEDRHQGCRKLAPLAPPVPDKPHLVGQNEIYMEKNIGHIIARAKKSCLTLTILLDTLSNHYWTNCPMTLGPPNIGELNMPWTKDIQNLIYCPMILKHIVQ